MTILLITGSTGFLGTYILEELDKKHEKFSFDKIRLLIRSPEKTKNLKSEFFDYEIVHGDLLDHESLRNAARGVDVLIHVAALFDAKSQKSEFDQANVKGTEELIQALEPGSKFILTSTTGVYGFPNVKEQIDEDYEPKKPYWHYQKSKKAQEDLAMRLCKEKGIEIIVIRPSLILGPNDLFFLPQLIETLKKKRVFFLRKDGNNIIPSVHAADAASAHLLALEKISVLNGEIFHLASFQPSIKELVNQTTNELGLKPVKKRVPYFLAYFLGLIGDILPFHTNYSRFSVKVFASHTELDLTKCREKLGWEPLYGIKNTIRDSVEWYNNFNPNPRA